MHSIYAGSASAIRIATATRSRELAALAARPQTRGASAGGCGVVLDAARAAVAERSALSLEPLLTEPPPQAASSKQPRTSAAHWPARPPVRDSWCMLRLCTNAGDPASRYARP